MVLDSQGIYIYILGSLYRDSCLFSFYSRAVGPPSGLLEHRGASSEVRHGTVRLDGRSVRLEPQMRRGISDHLKSSQLFRSQARMGRKTMADHDLFPLDNIGTRIRKGLYSWAKTIDSPKVQKCPKIIPCTAGWRKKVRSALYGPITQWSLDVSSKERSNLDDCWRGATLLERMLSHLYVFL